MKGIISLGKYLYALPFAVFGLFHFMNASSMAGLVPIPGGEIWVYLTGLGHFGFVIAVLIGKLDKLAAVLFAVMMLIFALSIHLPQAGMDNQMAMTNLLKDLSLAGGALLYAQQAKDNAIVG